MCDNGFSWNYQVAKRSTGKQTIYELVERHMAYAKYDAITCIVWIQSTLIEFLPLFFFPPTELVNIKLRIMKFDFFQFNF